MASTKKRTKKKSARTSSPKLGRQLLKTMDDLTEFMGATTDSARLREQLNLHKKLNKQLAELIDRNLDRQSAKYRNAANGLRDASAMIREAIKGLESIANAIKGLAKAADQVGELL